MRTLLALLVIVLLFAGCVEPEAAPQQTDEDVAAVAGTDEKPFLLNWKGRVVVGVLDVKNHDQPTEAFIFPFQQAGFNMEVPETPKAIEVRVDWKGDGGFRLHPHWLKGDNSAGTTEYYGYHSELYTSGTGCLRIPQADMASGIWPMMIHPDAKAVNLDFTITVGVIGTTAKVSPELHGHRGDGNYVIHDHEIEPCQFLNK